MSAATLKVFGMDLPVIQKLGNGWALVAHRNGPALTREGVELLASPEYPSDDIPDSVRENALHVVMALASEAVSLRYYPAPEPVPAVPAAQEPAP